MLDPMPLNRYTAALLMHIARYQPYDNAEATHCQTIIHFLKQSQHPYSRSTPQGHITGSAVLVNADRTSGLLIWHEKLRRWLQPGGHCEPDIDPSTAATALRELLEETGLPAQAVRLVDETPFDVDVHLIPAKGDEPAHYHYDVRYLFHLTGEQVDIEGGRWLAITELAHFEDESLARFGKKLLTRR